MSEEQQKITFMDFYNNLKELVNRALESDVLPIDAHQQHLEDFSVMIPVNIPANTTQIEYQQINRTRNTIKLLEVPFTKSNRFEVNKVVVLAPDLDNEMNNYSKMNYRSFIYEPAERVQNGNIHGATVIIGTDCALYLLDHAFSFPDSELYVHQNREFGVLSLEDGSVEEKIEIVFNEIPIVKKDDNKIERAVYMVRVKQESSGNRFDFDLFDDIETNVAKIRFTADGTIVVLDGGGLEEIYSDAMDAQLLAMGDWMDLAIEVDMTHPSTYPQIKYYLNGQLLYESASPASSIDNIKSASVSTPNSLASHIYLSGFHFGIPDGKQYANMWDLGTNESFKGFDFPYFLDAMYKAQQLRLEKFIKIKIGGTDIIENNAFKTFQYRGIPIVDKRLTLDIKTQIYQSDVKILIEGYNEGFTSQQVYVILSGKIWGDI